MMPFSAAPGKTPAQKIVAMTGAPVFPVHADKRPAVTSWQRGGATTRPPDHLTTYGVACGVTRLIDGTPHTLAVIDVDTKHGVDGFASLDRWRGELFLDSCLGLPATFTVKTPSGGAHLYYWTPLPIPNSQGRIGRREATEGETKRGSGVDTRGAQLKDGAPRPAGFVIGPGSVTAGGVYTVAEDAPVAALPLAVAEALLLATGPVPVDIEVPPEKLADKYGKIEEALFHIPPAATRERWINIGMALHGATGGSPHGLDLWHQHSITHKGENAADYEQCAAQWATLKPRQLGADALYHFAAEAGYRVPELADPTVQTPEAVTEAALQEMGTGVDLAKLSAVETKRAEAQDRLTLLRARATIHRNPFGAEGPLDDAHELIADILPGFAATGTLGFLGGPSGAGKSTTLMHLAHCLATDKPFFGREVYAPGGSLIIAGEDINGHLWRLTAQKRRSGDPAALPISIAESPGVSLASPDGRMWLEATIEEEKAYQKSMGTTLRLVVIDTLRQCLLLTDENDNAEAAVAMGMLRDISRKHEVVVLIVHHSPKVGRTLSGAGAFIANSDFVLYADAEVTNTDGAAGNPTVAGSGTAPAESEGAAQALDMSVFDVDGSALSVTADDFAVPAQRDNLRRTLSVLKSRIGRIGAVGAYEIHADVMRRQPLPKGKVRTIWGTYVVELGTGVADTVPPATGPGSGSPPPQPSCGRAAAGRGGRPVKVAPELTAAIAAAKAEDVKRGRPPGEPIEPSVLRGAFFAELDRLALADKPGTDITSLTYRNSRASRWSKVRAKAIKDGVISETAAGNVRC